MSVIADFSCSESSEWQKKAPIDYAIDDSDDPSENIKERQLLDQAAMILISQRDARSEEGERQYDFYSATGDALVFTGAEKSCCCCRCYSGRYRKFSLELFWYTGECDYEFRTVCSWPTFCSLFGRKMQVRREGQLVATIEQRCSIFPSFIAVGQNGQSWFRISCSRLVPKERSKMVFVVSAVETNLELARISRTYERLALDVVNPNKYLAIRIVSPLSKTWKITLIAAGLLLFLLYFENYQTKSNKRYTISHHPAFKMKVTSHIKTGKAEAASRKSSFSV